MLSLPFLPPSASSRQPAPATPQQALKALIAGNQRFLANQCTSNPGQSLDRLKVLTNHQAPFATIVTCADSRVPPERIFDQDIGDLFTVRVAGNVLGDLEFASCEYDASKLHTKLMLVLGHRGCGAVQAALMNQSLEGHLNTLIHAIHPAVERSAHQPGDPLENAVKANVQLQLDRLAAVPLVHQRLNTQEMMLVGAYLDISSGRVEVLTIQTRSTPSIRATVPNVF